MSDDAIKKIKKSWAYIHPDRFKAANERLAQAEEALRECVRLSGADLSDGFPTWPSLPEYAVQCVRQLREDYENAIGGWDVMDWQAYATSLEARVRELEAIQAAALEALRMGKDGEWKTVRADTARELLSGKISPAGWGRERR